MSVVTPGDLVPFTYEQDRYDARTRQPDWAQKNVRISYEILGDLDPEALAEAVRAFVVRNDALQMEPARDAAGVRGQRVRPIGDDEPLIQAERVTAASAEQFSRYAAALLSRDFVVPWSEDQQRPFRFRLLRRNDHHHAFLATFQNLVFDGRAHALFDTQLWSDYRALSRGESISRAAPSFAAAARRQRSRFGAAHLASARRSWQERLDFAARTPWVVPSGIVGTDDGVIRVHVDGPAVAALRLAGERERCTVMQWVVSSFTQALFVRAGQRQVNLWTTMDSRPTTDRATVGMFAAATPLSVHRPGVSSDEVRAQVRGQLLEALRYEQVTAAEIDQLSAATTGTGPPRRDLYVNLRTFDTDFQESRQDGTLQITNDAYPLRRVTFRTSEALHLRCDEFRDALRIVLIYDGQRVGRPLAQAIFDDMLTRIRATEPAIHQNHRVHPERI